MDVEHLNDHEQAVTVSGLVAAIVTVLMFYVSLLIAPDLSATAVMLAVVFGPPVLLVLLGLGLVVRPGTGRIGGGILVGVACTAAVVLALAVFVLPAMLPGEAWPDCRSSPAPVSVRGHFLVRTVGDRVARRGTPTRVN